MIAQQMLTSGLLMMRVRYLLLAARTQSNPISSKPSMPQYSARQFPQLPFAFSIFALLFSCSILAITEPGVMAQAPEARAQPLLPVLASKTFDLREPAEVGFEIKARSNGASWAKRGAEAAALLIEVDGSYNQDLLLWMGDKSFAYHITLGRLTAGQHTVSVKLNLARSAAGAKRAEILSLRPLPFASPVTKASDKEALLALTYSPILCARADAIDRFTDVPLLMYYELERPAADDLIVRYTVVFSHEDGGTRTPALMARWGRATDIEWTYQIRWRNGRILEETYQGVEHKTRPFAGTRTAGHHPLLGVASNNNNFSDSACSAMRFAPLPILADLTRSSREKVMDDAPWTYRVMAEELTREQRISLSPTGANLIADPRDYLYIEAFAAQQGTALAFDVKLKDHQESYASDNNDARLRIDRSGHFRSAVRLPHGTTPGAVVSITARCHASTETSQKRLCGAVRLTKVFMLDRNYAPRPLQLPSQTAMEIKPGDAATFSFTR